VGTILDILDRIRLVVLRLVAAGITVVGIVLLWLGYPPEGTGSFLALLFGGVFVFTGVLGAIKPDERFKLDSSSTQE
jgi:hypothetical protein